VVLLVVVRSRFARCRVQPAVGPVRRSRASCPLRWCGRLGRTRSAAAEQLVPRGLESDCLGDAVPTLTCIVSHHSVDRLRHLHRTSSYSFATRQILGMQTEQSCRPGGGETICPRRWQFDGGKNRSGSTSVRGRVRSLHIPDGRRRLSCRQLARL